MIDFLTNNLTLFWFILGFLLLGIEILALSFSTGFVLFIGLAALLTGGLVYFGVIPATWVASVACFAASSALVSIALWKPFKRMQSHEPPGKDNSSDIIGYKFRLHEDISVTNVGKTRYSGIEWRVEIDLNSPVTEISAGTVVEVVSVDAGKLRVVASSGQE